MKNIFNTIYLLLIVCILITCNKEITAIIDKKEAKEAFDYLNNIRSNPAAYSNEIGCDISYVEPRHALVWNEKLASAAERKAMDMAKRNYCEHVDPDGYGMNYFIHKAGYQLTDDFLAERSQNNFESIGAGYESGIKLIQGLILDKGYPAGFEGHRIHLLGIDQFWANCYDIGIGFVSVINPKDTSSSIVTTNYVTYSCILIAKQDY